MDFSKRVRNTGSSGGSHGLRMVLICSSAAALAATGCFDHARPREEVVARSMAEAARDAERVTFLDLRFDDSMDAFPEGLGAFPALRRISVRGRGTAAVVPPSLAEAGMLEELDLAETGVTHLPDVFASLKRLRNLYLSDNALSALPEAVLKASALEYLNLDRNALEALPEGMGALSSLKWVRLNGNRLSDLPRSASQWKGVRRLYLRGNGLTALPDAVLGMETLEELDLGDNDIRELPEALFRLPNLRRLDLDGNRNLSRLPGNIAEAKALTHLFLYHCPISVEERARIRAELPDPVRRFIAF